MRLKLLKIGENNLLKNRRVGEAAAEVKARLTDGAKPEPSARHLGAAAMSLQHQ